MEGGQEAQAFPAEEVGGVGDHRHQQHPSLVEVEEEVEGHTVPPSRVEEVEEEASQEPQ